MAIRESVVQLVLRAKNLLSKDTNEAARSLTALEQSAEKTAAELKRLESAANAAKSFGALIAQVATTKEAYTASATALAKLTNEFKKSRAPTEEMVVNLAKAKAETALLKAEWLSSERALSRNSAELRRSGVDISKLASEQNRLEKEVRQTNSAYQQVTTKIAGARAAMASASTATVTFGDRVRSLAASLGLLGGAIFIFEGIRRGLRALVGGFVSTGDQFEKLRIQLEALEGSSERAERALSFIKDLTKNTPLQLEGVTEAFVQLKTFGIDPMDGTLQSLIDQNSKLAGSQETLEGIIRAVGQAWTKQKLQAEEVNQLTERGVPVWDLLAKATGRNVVELQKLSSAGQLGRREIRALVEEIGRSASGSAAAQMKTLSGLASNLSDMWTDFLKRISDSGSLDFLKDQLRGVGERISALAKSGELDQIAKKISDAFVGSVEALKTAAGFIVRFKDEIIGLAKVLAGVKIAQFFYSMAASAISATASIVSLAGTLGGFFIQAVRTATALVIAFANVFRVTLVGAIAFAVVSIINLINKFQEYRKVMKEVSEAEAAAAEQNRLLSEKILEVSESTGLAIKDLADFKRLLKEGAIVVDEITGKYVSAAQAAELFAKRSSESANESERISKRISLVASAVEETAAQFKNLESNGKKIPAVLAEIFDGIELASPEKIRGLTIALDDLKKTGKITGTEVRDALSKAFADLPTDKIEAFRAKVDAAFKGLGDRAKQAADISAGALDALFAKLGVDADRFAKGVSRAGTELVSTFTQIAKTAGVTSDQVRAAFNASIDKAKTIEDVEALIQAFRNYAGVAGVSFEGIRSAELAAAEARLALLQTTAAATGAEVGYQGLLEQTKIRLLSGADAALKNADARSKVADAARDQADATKEAGDAAESAGGKTSKYIDNLNEASDWFSGILSGYGGALANLSEQAAQAFQGFFGAETEKQFNAANASMRDLEDGLQNAINKTHDAHDSVLRAHNAIDQWAAAWKQAAAETELAFFKQATAAKSLEEQLRDGSSASLDLIKQAERAVDGFDLLGDQQLGPLRKAIDDARERVRKLGEELSETVSDLQDQLDELQGREDDVRQREFDRKLAELQEKLKQAKASNDRDAIKDAEKAIELLRRIQEEKNKQAAADAAQREADRKEREARDAERASEERSPDKREAPSPQTGSSEPVDSGTVPPSQRFTLRLEGPSGSVDLLASSKLVVDEVLRLLAEAGLNVSKG